MTEQNPPTHDSPEGADTRLDWPATAGDPAGDPAVDALLVRLDSLPELPVDSHGEVYAGLHDDLAAALNEDLAGQRPGDTPR